MDNVLSMDEHRNKGRGYTKLTIDTKEIRKGIVTINGMQITEGLPISELESMLNIKIEERDKYLGYVLSPVLIEDGNTVKLTTWFEGENVRKLNLDFVGFNNDDDAYKYLKIWLKDRGMPEPVGSDQFHSYYQTEFGAIMPALVSGPNGYEIQIEFRYGEIPSRKFDPIKEKKNNFLKVMTGDNQYKIQRISRTEEEKLPHLGNWLGRGPFSLNEMNDKHSKDDRKEIIYFNISKIEDGAESVIGVAEFTYLAISNVYENSELFETLDGLTQEWGIIGYAIEKYGCGLENKKGITPYVLVFENIHDEIPSNKELKKFTESDNCMKSLFNSAIHLISKYVKVKEEDITLISVSTNKDNLFSYHKKCEDVFVNYRNKN